MPLQLYPASADDLSAVHALVERAYRGDTARLGWTHEADLLDGQRTDRATLESLLDDAQSCLLLFKDGGAIRACAALTARQPGLVYIGMLTVEPHLQGSGLGDRMLAATEAEAVNRFGARSAEMTVIAQRPELIAWYRRRGYADNGEQRPFPDDPRFGMPRRPDLHFVVLEKKL